MYLHVALKFPERQARLSPNQAPKGPSVNETDKASDIAGRRGRAREDVCDDGETCATQNHLDRTASVLLAQSVQ
jgi:hypothetical protein